MRELRKKMRDQGVIYAGLLVFLGLITAPFTYNVMTGKSAKGPEIRLPVQEKRCVAPTVYMKSSHMQLLSTWRDELVRKNIRTITFENNTYAIGLNTTCLTKCHAGKADFCDRCHNYVGVQGPYCMDCHIDPQAINRSGS